MKKYVTVWKLLLNRAIQRLFEYRADFFAWALVSAGWTMFQVVFYNIIFLQTSNIAGWSKPEVFLLLGTYMIIDSATWAFFWPNIEAYTESIFDGTLDYLLLQPIDTQFRLSVRYFGFTNLPRLLIGIYLVTTNWPAHVTTGTFSLYIAMLIVALFTVYSLWFFSATFTFWAEKLDNIIEIVPALRSLWSTPSDVFSGVISTVFTVIIPLALISTVPSRILLGKLRIQELAILVIFTIALTALTRWFFKFAVKRYAGVGS